MIKYLWQLPQHLVALLVILFNKKNIHRYAYMGFTYYTVTHLNNSAVSLGRYIFLDDYVLPRTRTIMHEYGHQRQSLYLGPLYLLVIGIPSAIGNILHRFIKFDYYKQPWESWADKLGGIVR